MKKLALNKGIIGSFKKIYSRYWIANHEKKTLMIYDNDTSPPKLKKEILYSQIREVSCSFYSCCFPNKEESEMSEGWVYKFKLFTD